MKGFIYMIQLNDDVYIGSTYDLKYRTRKHNNNIRKNTAPIYKYCRANDIKEVELILIEEIEHDTLEQLCIVEEQYRQSFNATLNGQKCHITKEEKRQYHTEWYQNNKEYKNEKDKEWYLNNKEHIEEWGKVKVTCEKCGSFVRRDGIAKHKLRKKCINLSLIVIV